MLRPMHDFHGVLGCRKVLAIVAMAAMAAVLVGCASGSGARTAPTSAGNAAVRESTPSWTLVIHGGAGTIEPGEDPALEARYRESLARALDAGTAVLRADGSAMDACEAAIRVLEDDELFNAGRGAALTRDGTAELDASIMDGSTLKCGAVTGVTTVRHPVSLARKVMENTRHILFAGAGAERLADQYGVERVENTWFVTPRRRQMLDELLQPKTTTSRGVSANEPRMGTVGAVARDSKGRLAAATSTGGLTGKIPGRVGDSPLIGAGNYANATVAVSCTGTGEQYIRHGVARGVAARMDYAKDSLQGATDYFIFTALNKDDGGLIAVDAKGNVATPFSTVGMYRGIADSKGRREVKIWKE